MKVPESLTQYTYRLIRNEILQGRLDSQQRLREDFFTRRENPAASPFTS